MIFLSIERERERAMMSYTYYQLSADYIPDQAWYNETIPEYANVYMFKTKYEVYSP